jgi:leucine-rich PPR motif-containing protein, mitochondrial
MKSFARIPFKKIQENHLSVKDKYIKASTIFKNTILSNKTPTPVEITKMFSGFTGIREIQKNEKILEFLKSKDIQPNISNYAVLMKGYADTQNLDKVEEIFKVLKQKKLLNHIVYGILIDAYCQKSYMTQAEYFLEEMKKEGLQPNIKIIGSLIFGYSKSKKFKKFNIQGNDIEKIWEFENRFDEKIVWNLKLYNMMLTGLCSYGHMEKAEEIYKKMITECIEPDQKTYGILINGFALKNKDINTAEVYFNKMLKNLVKIDMISYSMMIKHYSKFGDMEKAENLISKMKKDKMTPNLICESSLLVGYFVSGNFEKAEDHFKQLMKNHTLDVITFNIMIHSFAKKQKMEKAEEYLELMKKQNVKPSILTFEVLSNEYKSIDSEKSSYYQSLVDSFSQ